MSKTTKKKRSKIINLDDPKLVIGDDDFTTEFLKEVGAVKKKAIITTRNIAKRLLDEDEEIEVVNIDKNEKDESKIKNIFDYEGNKILMIVDSDGKPWCKAKDIATVLQYKNVKDVIVKNVSKKYKKSYADLGYVNYIPPIRIDPQTIFVSQPGMCELIFKSRLPAATKFYEWIIEEVIPELMEHGTYSIPVKNSDIERLQKSFYDDNMLSEFMGSPCIYFSYVGVHKIVINGVTRKEHVIKFGQTRKMDQRDLKQHRKFYKTFNVQGIWKTLANVEVENKIETNFQSLNMLVDLKIKGMNKTKEENKKEHIILTEKHDLDYCLNMIKNVVETTSLPQENEYKDRIKTLECEKKIQSIKIKHLEEDIKLLKENLHDLRKKHK